MKSPLPSFTHVWLIFAFVSTPALAQTDFAQADISAAVASQRASISSAKVILLPSLFFPTPGINEERLNQLGCHYEASDAIGLMALVDIVVNAEIKQSATSGVFRHGIDYRIGVYLTEQNGNKHVLLFEDQGVERPRYGTYNRTTKVRSTNPALGSHVRAWSANRASYGNYCSGWEEQTDKN